MRMDGQPAWMNVLTEGIPGELLLVLTILIWAIFAMILGSNVKNRLNIWCFCSGMLFSIGALKEYLFYTLGPVLIERGIWTIGFSETLYSLLSAVFYYLSMPSVIIFCLYFHRLDITHPRLFRCLQILVYLPGLAFSIVFPCTQTLAFQKSPVFCLAVGIYNWCYGLIGSAIMVHALMEERMSAHFRQRLLAAASLMVPLWFWLVSAFPYHALGVPNISKLWQVNLIVVLLVLLYFLYHAFRDGIWGIRFRRETYDWNSGNRVLQKNAQYVGHALKNDLSKIEWCTDFLAAQGASAREVDILRRSAAHLKQFISRTQLYSQKISLIPEACNIGAMLRSLSEEFNTSDKKRGTVRTGSCDAEPLVCDPAHVEEALRNLIANGLDAAGEKGEVVLSYQSLPRKRYAIIRVTDNGCGMDGETAKQLFEPYYTTKAGGDNLGLGLYYCWNVMSAHGGSIRVASQPGEGSTFSLLFPVKRKKRRRTDDGADPDCSGGGRS